MVSSLTESHAHWTIFIVYGDILSLNQNQKDIEDIEDIDMEEQIALREKKKIKNLSNKCDGTMQ